MLWQDQIATFTTLPPASPLSHQMEATCHLLPAAVGYRLTAGFGEGDSHLEQEQGASPVRAFQQALWWCLSLRSSQCRDISPGSWKTTPRTPLLLQPCALSTNNPGEAAGALRPLPVPRCPLLAPRGSPPPLLALPAEVSLPGARQPRRAGLNGHLRQRDRGALAGSGGHLLPPPPSAVPQGKGGDAPRVQEPRGRGTGTPGG